MVCTSIFVHISQLHVIQRYVCDEFIIQFTVKSKTAVTLIFQNTGSVDTLMSLDGSSKYQIMPNIRFF
jgi:hypothetical protein